MLSVCHVVANTAFEMRTIADHKVKGTLERCQSSSIQVNMYYLARFYFANFVFIIKLGMTLVI